MQHVDLLPQVKTHLPMHGWVPLPCHNASVNLLAPRPQLAALLPSFTQEVEERQLESTSSLLSLSAEIAQLSGAAGVIGGGLDRQDTQ